METTLPSLVSPETSLPALFGASGCNINSGISLFDINTFLLVICIRASGTLISVSSGLLCSMQGQCGVKYWFPKSFFRLHFLPPGCEYLGLIADEDAEPQPLGCCGVGERVLHSFFR